MPKNSCHSVSQYGVLYIHFWCQVCRLYWNAVERCRSTCERKFCVALVPSLARWHLWSGALLPGNVACNWVWGEPAGAEWAPSYKTGILQEAVDDAVSLDQCRIAMACKPPPPPPLCLCIERVERSRAWRVKLCMSLRCCCSCALQDCSCWNK